MIPGMSEQQLRELLDSSPFHGRIPIEMSIIEPDGGALILKLPFDAGLERTPGSGRFHGGAIASLIDVAGAFSLMAATGRNAPTTSLSVEYIAAHAPSSDLTATARVRHTGATIGVVDVEVRDCRPRLVALGRVSLCVAAAE
jgi:uncharacterized protein (TIGR00369 family)